MSLDSPGEPVFVVGDASRLRQVVENLLSNTSKFSREGAGIEVSLQQEQGRAVVQVRDAGKGLDPASLEQIFQM